jgi:hypothetical protein
VLRYLRSLHAPDDAGADEEDDADEQGEPQASYAASTLWSFASMLGRFLLKAYGIQGVAQKNGIIAAELAQWEKDETTKQAKVFTKEDVATFLSDVPTDDQTLVLKMVMILGISGLLRRKELYELQYQDVRLTRVEATVSVQRKKNKGPKETSYILINDPCLCSAFVMQLALFIVCSIDK